MLSDLLSVYAIVLVFNEIIHVMNNLARTMCAAVARVRNRDKRIGIGEGERFQDHGVDHREHRRVDPNAKSHGSQNGGR